MEWTLVSHEYHFRASFGQILKIAYFRLIFGQFPIVKSQNQKTYGAIPQIKSLKSSNGCFGLLIHKGTGCEVRRAQKNIFGFSGHPNDYQ